MSKTKQYPILTEEELEQVDDFFILVSGNANEEIKMMLEIWPNLIYAREENGLTALHLLVGSGQASNLETVSILMNYNPDLTMRDNNGWTVYTALQGSRDPLLTIEFAQLLIPGIQFEDTAIDAIIETIARESVRACNPEIFANIERDRALAEEATAARIKSQAEAEEAVAEHAKSKAEAEEAVAEHAKSKAAAEEAVAEHAKSKAAAEEATLSCAAAEARLAQVTANAIAARASANEAAANAIEARALANEAAANAIAARALVNELTARETTYDPLAEARAHFNTPGQQEITRVLNQLTLNLQEINYDQDLTNIFKGLYALNMDEQKKFDQIAFNVENSLLKGISFAPVAFESFSQDQLSIIIIPKELLEFSFEQLSNILGKIYEYFDYSDQE